MKRIRIHDCFMYAGEDDLLYLRLKTLAGVVDRFVMVEGTRTFSGTARELLFRRERFGGLADRLEHVVVDDLEPNPVSSWHNEYKQRNALLSCLQDAPDHDWVLLSDADEIPHPDAFARFRPGRFVSAVLEQRVYWYALNNRMISSPIWGDVPLCKARLATVGRLRRFYGSMQNFREYDSPSRFSRLMRFVHRQRTQRISPGGWHFSYLMTPAQIRRKIASFSHQELNLPEFTDEAHIATALRDRVDLFGGGRQFAVQPLDDSFPLPLLQERDRFSAWIR